MLLFACCSMVLSLLLLPFFSYKDAVANNNNIDHFSPLPFLQIIRVAIRFTTVSDDQIGVRAFLTDLPLSFLSSGGSATLAASLLLQETSTSLASSDTPLRRIRARDWLTLTSVYPTVRPRFLSLINSLAGREYEHVLSLLSKLGSQVPPPLPPPPPAMFLLGQPAALAVAAGIVTSSSPPSSSTASPMLSQASPPPQPVIDALLSLVTKTAHHRRLLRSKRWWRWSSAEPVHGTVSISSSSPSPATLSSQSSYESTPHFAASGSDSPVSAALSTKLPQLTPGPSFSPAVIQAAVSLQPTCRTYPSIPWTSESSALSSSSPDSPPNPSKPLLWNNFPVKSVPPGPASSPLVPPEATVVEYQILHTLYAPGGAGHGSWEEAVLAPYHLPMICGYKRAEDLGVNVPFEVLATQDMVRVADVDVDSWCDNSADGGWDDGELSPYPTSPNHPPSSSGNTNMGPSVPSATSVPLASLPSLSTLATIHGPTYDYNAPDFAHYSSVRNQPSGASRLPVTAHSHPALHEIPLHDPVSRALAIASSWEEGRDCLPSLLGTENVDSSSLLGRVLAPIETAVRAWSMAVSHSVNRLALARIIAVEMLHLYISNNLADSTLVETLASHIRSVRHNVTRCSL